ncbi:helix-turn-helix domain-containing protein [Nocardia sp. NPDC003963]
MDTTVRQTEQNDDESNNARTVRAGAAVERTPQQVIATALRRERARAELSLTEVARRAGIAKSTLSQLESGTGNPSLETLWALCLALEVPFSQLLDPPRTPTRVIRAAEGPAVYAAEADYRATLLAVSPTGVRRDIYRVAAEPGRRRSSQPHPPGTVEHVLLGAGRALVGAADDPVELEPGDYLAYPADIAHIFEALVPGTVATLISEYI